MNASIHIPEGLLSFYLSKTELTEVTMRQSSESRTKTIFLKRLVKDLKKWLRCRWAAGMIPSAAKPSVVVELNVVCVAGEDWTREGPDLICPVRDKTNTGVAAVIALGPRKDGSPYSDDDRRFANAVCEHIGGLMSDDRLARHLSEELSAVGQNAEDVEIARRVYARLDHCATLQIRGLEYDGRCRRAGEPGGDFFDLIGREGELAISIGTISARGLAAGIMLGGAVASIRALVSHGESPARIAAELNRTEWELSPEDSFTTFFSARISPARRCLRYVSAGHEPALVLRARTGHVERLESTGAVLGLSQRSEYRERVVLFEPGDLVAVFTDGLAESTGPDNVAYVLRHNRHCEVHELVSQVLDRGDTDLVDRTIVVARSSDAEDRPLMRKSEALAVAVAA
jgi:hypothetical protein